VPPFVVFSMRAALALLLTGMMTAAPVLRAAPLRVVCAEAVWCDVVRQIGGDAVTTQALILSPRADPHETEPTPSMARAIARADWVVANGGGYDPWMTRLAGASAGRHGETVEVAARLGVPAGDAAHFFDDPALVGRFARDIAARLVDRQGVNGGAAGAAIEARAGAFARDVDRLKGRLAALRGKAGGRQVALTEPVGTRMLERLGLKILDPRLARAAMHGAEPAARDVAAVEAAIRGRALAFLSVNPAVTSPVVARLAAAARQAGVPVVSMSEAPLPGQSWQAWYGARLDAVAQALETAADHAP